ncbi:hypothetical protein LNKW23_33970 [Paralimibaculum aggregatum]|uniref:Uncharacterized protein n=1 Tax=Paralimibaculum aggregatum TaxID=3036245 RepID=A0ABQ6LLX1_9RHOB|nr:hypothetical protein [Limibaculum sp. NKW23]GMG84183.1 hypothetical protein LNKW23_33970 [Limibaculum sp. NKW23]
MLRWLGRLLLLALVAVPVWLAAAMVEPAPLVPVPTEATPEDAHAARALVRRLRAVTENPDADPRLQVGLGEVNGAMAFGARLVPGLRGEARIRAAAGGGRALQLALSWPLPAGLGWLNAEAVVPEFGAGPRLERVRLGALALPPAFTLRVGAALADLVLGGDAGQTMLAAVPELAIGEDTLQMALRMDGDMRRGLTRRVSALLRGEEMPTGAEIQAHYVALRDAVDDGRLPDSGSLVPLLRFAAERVLATAPPGREAHGFTAALFALTKFCGAKEFRLVVGRLAEGIVPEDGRSWTRSCDGISLAGRIDTRRHFITAAAIKAASTIHVSFTIGEFKELFDAARRTGGFDFTDIVANSSGIRFAATMMAAPRADWPALIARLDGEAAVIPGFAGIPPKLSRAEFETRFGDVESAAYRAMLAEIEARIDRLALHAPAPGG